MSLRSSLALPPPIGLGEQAPVSIAMKPLVIWVADPCELFRDGLKHLLRKPRFSVKRTGATLAELLDDSGADPQPSIIIFGSSSEPDFEPTLKRIREQGASATAARFVLLVPEGELIVSRHRLATVVDAILPKNMPSEALAHFLYIVSLGQKIFLSRPGASASEGGSGSGTDEHRNSPEGAASEGLEAAGSASCSPAASVITGNSPQPPSPNGVSSPVHRPAAVSGYQTSLSVREWEILEGLKLGKPNKAIARNLNITESTVKVHVKSLLKKIRVNNRTQAAMWASEAQLGTPRPSAGLRQAPYSAGELGIPLDDGGSKPGQILVHRRLEPVDGAYT